MRTTFRDLEKRISRLEMLINPPELCNCRVETRFHDSNCLAAILEQTIRECPVHGFREMGFFFWTPSQYVILDEDNEICPCAPHPWRSFVLGPRPHTWEGHEAARQDWANMPDDNGFNLQLDRDRADTLLAAYDDTREQWTLKSRRRLPSQKELMKQNWSRYGKKSPR